MCFKRCVFFCTFHFFQKIIQKIKKVFLITKDSHESFYQDKSMAARYMNYFAIDEDDQFEIVAFQTKEKDKLSLDKAMQAVENLTNQQNKGSDFFRKLFIRDFNLNLYLKCMI